MYREIQTHKLLGFLSSSGKVFRDAQHHRGAGKPGVSTKMKVEMQNGAGSSSSSLFIVSSSSLPLLEEPIGAYLADLLHSSKRSLGYLLSIHHQ